MTLATLLEELAQEFGTRPALLSATDATSFSALALRSNAIAKGLARLGVGRGRNVGILLPNGRDWLATAFAALQLGAVVVPINTLLREKELAHALRSTDVAVLVAATHFLKHDYNQLLSSILGESDFPPRPEAPLRDAADDTHRSSASLRRPDNGPSIIFQPRLPALRHLVSVGDQPLPIALPLDEIVDLGASLSDAWLAAARTSIAGCEPAVVFFTSGTTATPKGAVHSHDSILCAANNVADCLGLDADDRTWGYLPFFFTGGLVAVATATLLRGGAVLLQEVFDAGATLQLMAQHRCTTLFAWPHQAEALAAHPDCDRSRLALRKGVGANSAWAPRLYRDDHQAVGTWGMTETGPMASAGRWHEPLSVRAASHGRPQPGVEIRIIDSDNGERVAADQEGEIAVRGATLMDRYYGMTRDDCFDREGFFRSGDLGRLDADGRLHFLGRIKDVIKTAGVNVAAAEVEAALLEHPRVKIAHVVGVPHPTRGENVAAFIVCAAAVPSSEELIAWCRERLASYKVPRQLVFGSESDLPLLASGKLDKRALQERISREGAKLAKG